MTEPHRLAVGRITGVHGIRGECVVEVLSEAPGRFDPGSVVIVERDGGAETTLSVAAARAHKQRLLVLFREVRDRNGAEALRGAILLIDAEHAAPLGDGEFYPHELDGASVADTAGRELGILADVLESPAHDIWVVRTADGREVLVPAVTEFIRGVDRDAKRIVIEPIGGMFD